MALLTQQQEKKVLSAVLVVFSLLVVYRLTTTEKPKTAPLAFPPGSVSRSAMRQNSVDAASGADPLSIFILKRKERYPGVSRDIFRMENPEPKPKPVPVVAAPAPPLPPPPPQRTPQEIAADLSRADLAKFHFLGYLTDKDKSTLFLSKDGELLIVKIGEIFGNNYQATNATKDYIVLIDTNTRVEMRFDLSGGEPQSLPAQIASPQPPRSILQPAHQPTQQTAQKAAPQLSPEPPQSTEDPDSPTMPERPLRRRVRPVKAP